MTDQTHDLLKTMSTAAEINTESREMELLQAYQRTSAHVHIYVLEMAPTVNQNKQLTIGLFALRNMGEAQFQFPS